MLNNIRNRLYYRRLDKILRSGNWRKLRDIPGAPAVSDKGLEIAFHKLRVERADKMTEADVRVSKAWLTERGLSHSMFSAGGTDA